MKISVPKQLQREIWQIKLQCGIMQLSRDTVWAFTKCFEYWTFMMQQLGLKKKKKGGKKPPVSVINVIIYSEVKA